MTDVERLVERLRTAAASCRREWDTLPAGADTSLGTAFVVMEEAATLLLSQEGRIRASVSGKAGKPRGVAAR